LLIFGLGRRLYIGEAMNYKRLKKAEADFLKRYPGGFEHPEMVELGKKHKKDKMVRLAQECFAKKNFREPVEILSSMVKVVSQSSMVSVFEKPKFRDMVKSLSKKEKDVIAKGLKDLLHGNEKRGFETILAELATRKMAKWTLMTVIQTYFRPDKEVFIKPTTTKDIINNLDLNLIYKPTPSWEFYESYRDIVNKMKKRVAKSLSPSNAAFCGFLMMVFDEAWKK
jgi:hypothetical protein